MQGKKKRPVRLTAIYTYLDEHQVSRQIPFITPGKGNKGVFKSESGKEKNNDKLRGMRQKEGLHQAPIRNLDGGEG